MDLSTNPFLVLSLWAVCFHWSLLKLQTIVYWVTKLFAIQDQLNSSVFRCVQGLSLGRSVRPSVGPSVPPSVRNEFFFKPRNLTNKFVWTKMPPKGRHKDFLNFFFNFLFEFFFQLFNGISMVICSQGSISRHFQWFYDIFTQFKKRITDGRTEGGTDRPTDRRTDRPTDPYREMRGCI